MEAILALANRMADYPPPGRMPLNAGRMMASALDDLAGLLGMQEAVFGRWSWPDGTAAQVWSTSAGPAALAAFIPEWVKSAAVNGSTMPDALIVESPDDAARMAPRRGWGAVMVIPAMIREGQATVIAAAGQTAPSTGMLPACAKPLATLAVMIESALRRGEIEAMLGSAVRQWHSMIDAIKDVIVLADMEGRVMRGNQALADCLGRSNRELIGQPCLDPLYDGAPEATAALERLRSGGERQNFEMRLRGRDMRVTLDPMVDAEGRLSGAVHILSDVTEQKKLERQLAASERMKMIGRLASGVAHEVRNPLNAILSLTEALQQEINPDAEQAQFLEMISAQVGRLSTLMRDLLDLGKPIPPSSLQPESLRRIVAAAADLWRMSKPPHPQHLEVSIVGQAGRAIVMADSARFQQVILNLLDNAAQHSPPESVIMIDLILGEIAFHNPTEADKKVVVVRVVDAGTGIPEENLQRVFEPFMTTRRQGTGLGLSLVQNIVEHHHGTVSIYNNTVQAGCTVQIRLPLAAMEDKA